MFYIVKEMRSEKTAQIVRDHDRDYEAVLDFVHELQDVSANTGDFDLFEVCEADEIYVAAGKNGEQTDDEQSRERGLPRRRVCSTGGGGIPVPPRLAVMQSVSNPVRCASCSPGDLQVSHIRRPGATIR